VNRFHETNQIGRIELDPTNLILRSRAQHGVLRLSKDEGWPLAQPRPWPSFETPTFGRLLRTRLMDDIDMDLRNPPNQFGPRSGTHFALRLAILTVWASIETLKRDKKLNPKSPSTPWP